MTTDSNANTLPIKLLRRNTPGDEPFLFRLYASTRADELVALPWTDEQKLAFLRTQYEAQRHHYARAYPDAIHQIVLLGGAPAGRMLVDHCEHEVLLVDISLLPEARDRGIGTGLIADLQREAGAAGKPVRLHVALTSPANRLYERVGFRSVGDDGVYREMVWEAEASAGEGRTKG